MKLSKKIKKIIATGALLLTLGTATPALAKTKQAETPKETKGSFAIAPAFSLKDQYGTVRLSGGGQVYGIGVGGFLDLYGSKERPADMDTHYGKITASKSIAKGLDAAVEYTTMSSGKDEIRAGVSHSGKLGKGGYKVNVYPVTPKGKGVHVGVFVGQDITDKIGASAFITSDLGDKTYYGEAEITCKVGKGTSVFVQERYGGKFGKAFKPATHVGVQVRF